MQFVFVHTYFLENSLKRKAQTIVPSPLVALQRSPLKQVISTPAHSGHPALRDITNSAQALRNPPDLFVKRSRRLRAKTLDLSRKDEFDVTETSKLATTVFPDDAEREIEHASSKAEEEDDLKGPSKVIPELTDLSKNLEFPKEEVLLEVRLPSPPAEDFQRHCVIETVECAFVVEAGELADDEICE